MRVANVLYAVFLFFRENPLNSLSPQWEGIVLFMVAPLAITSFKTLRKKVSIYKFPDVEEECRQ